MNKNYFFFLIFFVVICLVFIVRWNSIFAYYEVSFCENGNYYYVIKGTDGENATHFYNTNEKRMVSCLPNGIKKCAEALSVCEKIKPSFMKMLVTKIRFFF